VQAKDAHVLSRDVPGSNPPCFRGREAQKVTLDISRKLTLLVVE
jgi:hypothetical protein